MLKLCVYSKIVNNADECNVEEDRASYHTVLNRNLEILSVDLFIQCLKLAKSVSHTTSGLK